MPRSLREHCLQILEGGSLEAKLAVVAGGTARLDDSQPGESLDLAAPVRAPGIALAPETSRLPRPGELRDRAARAECLARFAHHELMAVELFAWALLKWPELDSALRRGLAGVLDEEREHCRLYLARLEAHGSALERHALSGYFWLQLPVIRASQAGASAFLAAMGLTLEQANLDFTLTYRDAFREAGDEASAAVCQRVHDEEVGHVRLAAEWLRKLQPEGDDLDRYRACVPYPLGEARAKGRRFDAAARRRAGLDETLIEAVRTARSSQERAPRSSEP